MNSGHPRRARAPSTDLWQPRATIKPKAIVRPGWKKFEISQTSKNNIYLLIASAGFVVQMIQLSRQYLRFETDTQLTITRGLAISPPSINMCFPVGDMVNYTRLLELYGTDVDPSELTIEQLFSITPKSSQIAQDCYLHRQNWYGSEHVDCNEFEFEKLFKRGMICFSVGLVSKKPFGYNYVMNDSDQPFLYAIKFRGEYFRENPYYYFFFKSQHKQFHGNGDSFLQIKRLFTNRSTGAGDGNWVTLRYSVFKSKRLPAPYTSMCVDYTSVGFESRDECYERCLINKTIAQFNKLPFNVLTNTHHLHRRYGRLSSQDIVNDTIRHELSNLEAACGSKCWNPDCMQEDIVPEQVGAEHHPEPGLSLFGSNNPQIITEFSAKISLVDYLSISFSCLGFWIAFSPLTFFKDVDFLRLFSQSTTQPKVELRRPIAPRRH